MTEKLRGISGSMAAGKTDRIIDLAKREGYKKHTVLAYKPSIDNRWDSQGLLTSRVIENGKHKTYPAVAVENAAKLLEHVTSYLEDHQKPDHIFIDEIQFFDESIIEVVKHLLEIDIPVTFSGLALDFRGEPFGQMPTLLALCDEIEKPTAICEICGDDATRTQRLINDKPANYHDPIVLVGAEQNYQARCVKHHFVPGKPQTIYSR